MNAGDAICAIMDAAIIAWLIGLAVGAFFERRGSADAAVSDKPPAWWLKELEFAKGRKNAAAVKEPAAPQAGQDGGAE